MFTFRDVSKLRDLDKGFRTAPLIRFVGKEDGLLSYTTDTPRVFLNIEDYLFYNQVTHAWQP